MDYPRHYNAATDFIDRNIAKGLSEKTAFIDPVRSLTYGDLGRESCRAANLMISHGLGLEDRVAMLVHDTVDFPVIFWGAIKAGIVPVALNTLLSTDQYHYILEDSRAKVLFISAALLETLKPALAKLPRLKHIFVVGGDSGDHIDFAKSLAAESDQFETVETCADETAFWLYSSGSTGMPKGVPHIHSSLMETARLFGQGVLGIQEDDMVYSAAKLFFAYGLGNGMSFPLSVGATTILFPGRPTPDAVLGLLKEHQPSIYCGVPTLYAALLAHPDCNREKTSARLRICLSAGEALPEDVGTSWRKTMGVDILDGVGSTEMLHIFLSNRPGDIVYGTSGIAVPGYDLRLVDEEGQDITEDDVGELLVRGSSAASGYWNQREKTRRTFEGEWTRTGDKYTRDSDGRYHYCGRTDDMFKVSGIWVSPFEVESALISHESVLEAAVVPFEDPDGLTKPKAFVILQEGASSDGMFEVLKDHVQTSVGKWKYPREIVFVDSLPKTATGKIQRFKLRD
ncbi:benzoate-CoA ligase family protein [Denitrobaculum tricleocarpae]|uniref:Benzoate-CoA ligase family protein n=1 Tax=Denitrobaculum tricleocarpae TaxID=2591009 RepID=A0A545TQN7_9PROT|nr:benzoate-CoA ligase family protein [Denitrobaculum tricleocarpae]TQV79540.1 benzoate-CoA ligase family protein [Denitrobaculum tricleocarpae]